MFKPKPLIICHYHSLTSQYRYIEIIKVFKINEIIADIKQIHATYRIFSSTVKSESRKMRLLVNKKGKSMGSDSPS